MPRELTPKEIEHVTNEIKAGAGSGQLSAIKLYKRYSGKGMSEAKDFVDTVISELQKQDPETYAHLTKRGSKGCGAAVLALLLSFGGICASIATESPQSPSSARVDVVLTAVPAKGKVPIVKIVRDVSGKSMRDVLQLMKELPAVISTDLSHEQAQTLANRLTEVSAETQLVPHDAGAQQLEPSGTTQRRPATEKSDMAVEQPRIGNMNGSISQGGKEMPIKSYTSTWDADEGKLSIVLFPFALTPSQQASIKKWGSPTFIIKDQDTPNAKSWPGWCPYASLTVDFKTGTSSPSSNGVTNWHLALQRWDGPYSTVSQSVPQPEAGRALSRLQYNATSDTPLVLTMTLETDTPTGISIELKTKDQPGEK